MFKKIGAFLLMTAILLTTACQSQSASDLIQEQNAYEKIQKSLVEMKSYRSNATVAYISNKGTNTYDTLQACKITGEYRVEVTGPKQAAGNITLSDGNTICQYSTKIQGKVSTTTKENQERSEIFLTTFIKNYLNSNEVSISVGNFGEGKCTILEAVIPGNHPYLSTEKLWVDNKTLQPVKLMVFDPDGSERIIVTYNDFEYNAVLDESLFTI